jgi:hypothetical protein
MVVSMLLSLRMLFEKQQKELDALKHAVSPRPC